MHRGNNEDMIGSPYDQNNVLKVIDTDNGRLIDFFLIEEIETIEDYIDFLRELNSAKEIDTVRIHINCYGGDVNVALNIYDALKYTKAQVEVWVEGMAASAASMIMLAAHSWQIFPHSKVMIHAWTAFQYGKWNELQEQFKFDKEVWENQFKEIYKNFLTDEEITECLRGKDFWFSSDDTIARLNKFQADEVAKQDAVQEIIKKYEKLINDEIKVIEKSEKTATSATKKKATTTKKSAPKKDTK
jgi:ATP-dependent protease ClpP protease subunit